MFSDLPHYPRYQVVMRKTSTVHYNVTRFVKPTGANGEILRGTRGIDVDGKDRHNFFFRFVAVMNIT